MKYTRIEALEPENEKGLFAQADMNEGTIVSKAHLDAIENSLNENASKAEKTTELEASLKSEKDANIANAQKISDLEKTNADLKAKNEELGKKSSGEGTVLEVKEDAELQPTKVPSYFDENNPTNKWANEQLAMIDRASETRRIKEKVKSSN